MFHPSIGFKGSLACRRVSGYFIVPSIAVAVVLLILFMVAILVGWLVSTNSYLVPYMIKKSHHPAVLNVGFSWVKRWLTMASIGVFKINHLH